MLDLNSSLFVEYCNNCSSHAWCTSHDEARYHNFFLQIRDNIEKHFPGVKVYGNTHPSTGKQITPGLGAFEVVYKTCKVFSKLKSGLWPSLLLIDSKVEQINNGIWPEDTEFINYEDISINKEQMQNFKKDLIEKKMPIPSKTRKESIDNESIQKSKEARRNKEYVVRTSNKKGTKLTELKRGSKEFESNKATSHSNIESVNASKNGIVNSAKAESKDPQSAYFLSDGQRKSIHDIQPFAVRRVHAPYTSSTPSAYSSTAVNRLRSQTEQSRDKKSLSYVLNAKNEQASSITSGLKNTTDTEKPRGRKNQQPKSLQEIATTMTPNYQLSKLSIPSFLKANAVKEELAIDKESASATVFSLSSLRSNNVEDNSAHCDLRPGQRLKWFPDCQKHHGSPERLGHNDDFEEPIEAILRKGSFENKELHPLSDRKLINLNQAEQVAEYDKSDNAKNVTDRSLIKMIRTCFPEEKSSTIKITKDHVAKKKITITGDKNKDCKIEVYSTWPSILKTESNVIKVPRGASFKVPLRFDHYDVENTNKCQLFLFKDNQPWQKIRIEPDYV